MEGIESTATFEEKISLTPRDLANHKLNIHSVLLAKLAEKMEGKCSLHGWVLPDSVKILSKTVGYLEPGRFTGDYVFHVQAQAKVLNPPSGSRLVCEVVGNNMMGMYVSYRVPMKEFDKKTKKVMSSYVDAVKVILPRDLHIGDEDFAKVEIGERVYTEIKKSRFQVNDKFILSVGVFEGKVGSDYVAPKVEEVEEVVVAQAGPSKEAEKELEQFEEKEAEALAASGPRTQALAASGPRTQARAALPPLENATTGLVVEAPVAPPRAGSEPLLFNAAKIQAFKELDNRFPAPFTLDGKQWPSVEHYYQAMKFPTLPEFQETIRLLPTATEAAKLGKTKNAEKPIRADWKEQREDIMNRAIAAKFEQNPALKELLLNTYPRPLVFADANDAFWGYGKTKMGTNKLGALLLNYRSQFRGMDPQRS
jgi:N-glycosidase YbiA